MRSLPRKLRALVAMAVAICWMTAVLPNDPADAQATAATKPTSAADLYRAVNQMMAVDCPASSNLTYPEYPPYGPAWDQMAKAAWDAEQPALARVREARSIKHADWPKLTRPVSLPGPEYLNAMRNVANHLGDAALYEHFQRHDAAAIDTIEDLFVMSNLLDQQPWNSPVHLLVGGGIRALRDSRLMLIASDVHLTNNPADHERLRVSTAHQLIDKLLGQNDPTTQWSAASLAAKSNNQGIVISDPKYDAATLERRAIETLNRVNAEQTFTAMSLACHLFFTDHQRWPISIDELITAYLPHKMIDPWGDGRQAIGYVLVKGGLPDGSDRPMVYSRCGSTGQLFYRVDAPQYGFYTDDGSNANRPHHNPSGQFRDVASWVPPPTRAAQPATRALQSD